MSKQTESHLITMSKQTEGSIMNPSKNLRFVERIVPAPEHGEGIGKTVRILQQWWVLKVIHDEEIGEWRDVPLEIEEEAL